jgi:hypothetical protein
MVAAIRAHAARSDVPETVVLYGYTPEQATTLRRLLS